MLLDFAEGYLDCLDELQENLDQSKLALPEFVSKLESIQDVEKD